MASYKMCLGIALNIFICTVCIAEHVTSESDSILGKVEKLLEAQNKRNEELENTVRSLGNQVKNFKDKNRVLENKLKEQEIKVASIEPTIKNTQTFCKEKYDILSESINKLRSTNDNRPSVHRRQQAGASAIAFSSYLDHDLDGIGTSQAILFNQIQLNDGNGYNKHTGAFTVPVTGVYVFTFFIGERNTNQLYVKLVVNGSEKSDAVVETVQDYHDAQGGNVVILKVNKGDSVMIQRNGWGTHIEGSNTNRLSTFSGFLLYETEGSVIIGK